MLKYFQILGLPEKASLNDIKKAYRRLVVLYHPDKNKEPGAAEKFIEITEAYEILIDFRTNGPKRAVVKTVSREELIRRQKEEARRKAMWAANMRYKEYMKSREYQSNQALNVVMEYFFLGLSIFFVFLLPVYLVARYGWVGLISGAIIAAVSIPFSIPAFRNIRRFSLEHLRESLHFLTRRQNFYAVILPLLNLIVFMKIGLQTLMPFYTMIIWYIIPGVLLFLLALVYKKGRFAKRKVFAGCVLGPTCLTVFLLLNFFISFHPTVESYRFHTGGGSDGFLVLEDKAYDSFPGVRAFMSNEEALHARRVYYTFRTGVFGVRVMTDYYFN